MPKKPETTYEEPTTKEQAKKYDQLIGKNFIRIDPATKKPWPEAKEFFWMITHHFRSTCRHAAGFRVMFQIQKVYRNKTVEVDQRTLNGGTEKVKKNVPWKETTINEEGIEELYASGDRLIDAEQFTKEFAIDKASVPEQTLMSEASADDAGEEAAA